MLNIFIVLEYNYLQQFINFSIETYAKTPSTGGVFALSVFL